MAKSLFFTALVALLAGFAGAAVWSMSGLGDNHTRTYLIENPEILPEMADAYQQGLEADRLADAGDAIAQPFPGAVLGNPEGSVTLVEFTDYGCTYCRASVAHVQQLISANPDLKVVVREWPIFEGSENAARMALAAAQQGKFAAYHDAMFAAGTPSQANITAVAKTAGLDLAAAETFALSQQVDAELAQNHAFGRQLQFSGTPSWVVGSKVIEGMVGPEALQDAIDAAKQ